MLREMEGDAGASEVKSTSENTEGWGNQSQVVNSRPCEFALESDLSLR